MCICMHISFLERFCQEYRFLPSLAGLGDMRGDVTGMEEPPEDLQDISANVGDLKISSGPLQRATENASEETLVLALQRNGAYCERVSCYSEGRNCCL